MSRTPPATRLFGVLESVKVRSDIKTFRLFMKDNGIFPNNEKFPLVLMKNSYKKSEAEARREITKSGTWANPWAWGVFEYHHYHSKAWELLLCVQGEAKVQLGGENGLVVKIEKGDLVYVPPGFAHKQLSSSNGFTLLGSYPTQGLSGSIDTLTGAPTLDEREAILKAFCPSCPLSGISMACLSDACV